MPDTTTHPTADNLGGLVERARWAELYPARRAELVAEGKLTKIVRLDEIDRFLHDVAGLDRVDVCRALMRRIDEFAGDDLDPRDDAVLDAALAASSASRRRKPRRKPRRDERATARDEWADRDHDWRAGYGASHSARSRAIAADRRKDSRATASAAPRRRRRLPVKAAANANALHWSTLHALTASTREGIFTRVPMIVTLAQDDLPPAATLPAWARLASHLVERHTADDPPQCITRTRSRTAPRPPSLG
jgi:hypothetical protein